MRSRDLTLAAAAMLCLLAPASARSEPLPSVDLRLFQPSADPKGSLYMEPVATPGPGQWNASGWMSYAYRPVVLRGPGGELRSKLVSHQLSFDVLANIGIGARGAAGLSIPTVLRQWGDTDPATASVMQRSSRPDSALGDLALHAKAVVVKPHELGGFGLAALGRVSLPTGDRGSFAGEGAVTSEVRLLGEMNFIVASLQATAGFRTRTARREFAGKTWGDELPWGVGVAVRPQAFGWDAKGRWTWVVEAHGWLPAGPSAPFTEAALSPALLGASARYAVRDLSLLAGVEGPLNTAAGVPLVRGIVALQWAPRPHDADKDGVEDELDECPDLAEDRDGFEDHDGCPDFDNDDDGVPDADDRCPTQKEDEDGFDDDDGCPDPDNDKDGILDEADACPDAAGPRRADRATNGCPTTDRDGDGVPDDRDKCPDEPEDRDGFQDEDGCVDPDNDGDGVVDADDKCPLQAGPASSFAKWNGCPVPDKDGDTFHDEQDQCPSEPETWNGVRDDDGCPDEGGRALVALQQTATGPALVLLTPLGFKGPAAAPEVADKSLPTVRAVATELNRRPSWVVAVGVKPAPAGLFASTNAMMRSFAVVSALRAYTFRDGVAETVGWTAVKDQPGADRAGLGFLVLVGDQPADTAPSSAIAAEPANKPATGGR